MNPSRSSPQPQRPGLRHELRTPLNHIVGYSEMLLEQLDDLPETIRPQIRPYLQQLLQEGRRLFAMLQALSVEGQSEPISLEEWLRPAEEILRVLAQLRKILQQQKQDSWLSDLERIGAAAHQWINLIQAHPDFASWFCPPHPISSETQIPSHSTDPLKPEPQLGSLLPCCKVLIAEDDEANRELLTRRLLRLGLEVKVCHDGEEAVQLLQKEPFDLLILDLFMPRKNGVEVLQWIRSLPTEQQVPVIITSALDEVEGIGRCIELGAEDYLIKPVNMQVLVARLHAALEKKRLRDAERRYLEQIRQEQEKVEQLLLNVLPAPIAQRLKNGETTIVDSYEDCTVLFADLAGFTSWAAQQPPTRVVEVLNTIFTAFDELASRFGLEKIKTIGDAYMAVAGVPEPNPYHAEAAAEMALELLRVLEEMDRQHDLHLRMRVGLNSGPVLAGVIGRHKFSYDLWGDTVNLASRLENMAEPGTILIGPRTAQKLSSRYKILPLGDRYVRGRGTVKVWRLLARKPELSPSQEEKG